MLRRLIVICHEGEKLIAHAMLSRINNPVETCVIKDIRNQQEFEQVFRTFSGPKDIHICLMTDKSCEWMRECLSQTEYIIRQRALAVFSVLFGRFSIPYDFFSSFPIITSTGDISDLSNNVTKVIHNFIRIDFGMIKSWNFENLVKDLLEAYNFKNITLMYSDHVDFGYDMMCTYNRDDVEMMGENWLIEVKYAAEERLTIRYIDSLLRHNRDNYPEGNKVMLITNGLLTSPIWEYVERIQEQLRISIFIVDGRMLSGLVSYRNNLVNEYFPYE